MKHLLFGLLLLPCSISAQEAIKTVYYRLDTIRADSFYLLETSLIPTEGRNDTLNNYIFFRDTVDFRLYYENIDQAATGLTAKIAFLTAERDSLRARATRLGDFQDDLNTFAGNPANRFLAPFIVPAVEPLPAIPEKKRRPAQNKRIKNNKK